MAVAVYTTGHSTSDAVCRAFAAGLGVPVRAIAEPLRADDSGVFVYGKLRGTMGVIARAAAQGLPWFYADNGYLGGGHFDGCYKVTANAMQWDGSLPWQATSNDRARLARLGVKLAPWRTSGEYILVCPPIPAYDRALAFDGAAWLADTLAALRRQTKRELRIRYKPGDPRALRPGGGPARLLAEDLTGAWALVTHDSNVAVEAVVAGVPVFASGVSPARALGNRDPTRIQRPDLAHDRLAWLAVLAGKQWTLDEMRDGRCRTMLGL